MYFASIKARDTIERLAAASNPYAVTRTDLVDAVRLFTRQELAARFADDKLLANFVLNHWEFAHGIDTLSTYPWNVVIPISDVCNARCTFCNSWLRGKRLLKLADLERFSPVLRTAAMISLEGHGEPLVHPQFDEIARKLRETVDRRCRFSIITNGLLLDERLDDLLAMGVNVFNVSLNAASPATHDQVMGLGADAFVRVTTTLRELSRRGSEMEASERPSVNLSLVVTAMNIHEIPQFIQLAESLGASQVNLRTLLPQTELLAGLNYHVLPAYLAKDFDRHVDAAKAAISGAKVTVDADVASWSKPIFPAAVQGRIDSDPPILLSRREGQSAVVLQKEDYRELARMTSKGELLDLGKGDPQWTIHEELSPDTPDRAAWFKCSDVYTTLHMNDFFFVLRPCCYMDAVPNHDVIKYDGSYDFFEAWNSAAMVSLRKRLHEGPLYSMCRRCPQQLQYPAPESRSGDYESVPGALGHWEAQHWSGEAIDRGRAGVLIVTPKEQWAYAAFMPILLSAAGIGGRVVVDVQVEEGTIGVCLLHAQGERFLAEIARDTRSPAVPISFRVADFSNVKGVIVRNRSAGGKRSRVLVHSVEVQQRQGFGELIGYRVNRVILTLHDMDPTKDVASVAWLENDGDYELVSGGTGLWEADALWDAERIDHGTEGIEIVTPMQQWAYAAFMPFRVPAVGIGGRVVVDLQVEEGAVGVALLDAREEKFLAEIGRDTRSSAEPIVFRGGDLSRAKGLMVRNTSGGGKRSRVRVRSVAVQQRKGANELPDDYLVNRDGLTLNDIEPDPGSVSATGPEGRGERGLRLVGTPLPWASLAIARFGESDLAMTGPAAIRIRLRVLEGQVLVGLLDKAGSSYVSQTFWGKTAEQSDIILHCDAVEDISAVVVRASNTVEPPPVVIVSGLVVAFPESAPLH
jgi:pyruvate-formate lyase-activating enzyme